MKLPEFSSPLRRSACLLIGLIVLHGCAEPRRVPGLGSGASVQSKGDFKVALFLTDDLDLLKERWAQPTPPTLPWINAAKLGDELHAVLIFTGCAADASGFCRVVSRFAITDPEGGTHPSDAEYAVCVGKPPPPIGQLQLAEYAHTFGITKGPRGAYTISATVDDQVSGTSLDLAVPLLLR